MRKHLLYLLILLLSVNVGIAQFKKPSNSSSFNINTVGESQLFQLWRNANSMGMPEAEILKLFTQMGVNGGQYLQLKKRFDKKVEETSESDLEEEAEDLNAMGSDTSMIKQMPLRKNSPIFGMRFFSNPKNTFTPNIKLAAPQNYMLGPDDQLQLILTGVNESTQLLKINADGFINIKYAGIVTLSGLTLEAAKNQIIRKMQSVYPNLRTGRTNLTVLLSKYRTIRVSVAGEAYRPGNYQIPGISTIFNLLYLTGGPTEKGTLRNIHLIRNNKKIATIDFYQFLLQGSFENDIRLEDQDVIYFPFYQKHVYLAGAVKRPAIYELTQSDVLSSLLNMAGGFGDTAYKERVKIFQLGAEQRTMRDISKADFVSYLPQNGDSIQVDKINETYANKVYINGAVVMPGNYELTNELSLKKLIEKAGGIKETAFLTRGYINRINNSFEKQLISFDLTELQNRKELDIPLTKNDSVYIPTAESLRESMMVEIEGAVKKPGAYEFRDGMKIEDALLLAGGLTTNADFKKIIVLRHPKNTADTIATKVLDEYTLSVTPNLKSNNSVFSLSAKDKIIVASFLNNQSIGNVKIAGEILYPGNYPIEDREETAMDILKRAGGLTPFGNMAQIKIFKSGILVGLNFGENTYRIGANDSLYIPKIEPLVEVSGAVSNQQFVLYSSNKLRYYILAAGGVTNKGTLKKSYVQYANGLIKKTKHFLFFRSYPTIKAGSKIVVPAVESSMAKLISTNNVSAILTSLTALISLIVLLKK